MPTHAGNLSDKTILLTGGSSGIGHAMAVGLAAEGARVAIVSRRPPGQWEEAAPHGWNPGTDWIRADLAEGVHAVQALEQWLSTHGNRLDAVVTCAVDYASPSRHPFEETTMEEWDALFDVNARGVFLAVRATLPHLLKRGRGLVAGVTSDVAFSPGPLRIGYAASKAAARALFDGLAAEMVGRGVNVVQLLPTRQVATPGLRLRRPPFFDFAGYTPPSAFADPICRLVCNLGASLNGRVVEVGGQVAAANDGDTP
jgi:NAD(P)-dependent dehydrogenase (short-subunit alcohol dehydrogenase family)